MQGGGETSESIRGVRERPAASRLGAMDRVRLGRALGYGTRHAAKTIAAMAEAAAASPAEGARGQRGDFLPPAASRAGAVEAPARAARAPVSAKAVGNGVRELRRSVWQPLAVFSGALWLRVTGTFFAMIAFTVGAGAWRLKAGWEKAFSTPGSTKFWVFVVVAGMFAYFAVSSFVRANRMERRAARV